MTPETQAKLDASPIWAEMNRLAPDYVPDTLQIKALLASPDPVTTARLLEARMEDVKADAARFLADLGCEVRHITNAEALHAIRNFWPTAGIGGNDKGQATRLGTRALVQIGARIGAEQSTPKVPDFVTACYLAFLGRMPDAAGHAWHLERIENGTPPWEVARGIWSGPEATRRRAAQG